MTSPVAPLPRVRVRQHLAALAQLAAVGALGTAALLTLAILFGVGVGLAPVLGVGLVLLLAALYGLWATSWVEHERVEGLYGSGVAPLRLRPREGTGFSGWLRTLWRQFIDGQMWRGIASVVVSTVLGLIVLWTISVMVSGVALILPRRGRAAAAGDIVPLLGIDIPAEWALAAGIITLVLCLALLMGIALLHAVFTRAMLVPSREAQFAERARTAGAQREGAVRASELERTRIERDLHDGVQPRLVSVAMTLGLAQQKIDTDPAAARALIDEAHASTKAAITELRQLARGIHTSVLDDRGLDAALSALAARSPIPVHLDVRLDRRCSRTAEAAIYFVIAESLTNAAKHSHGSEARVTVRARETDGASALWARIDDNGIGGARVQPGGGLDGIANRVAAAGGTLRLDSPAGGPTTVEVIVPCAS